MLFVFNIGRHRKQVFDYRQRMLYANIRKQQRMKNAMKHRRTALLLLPVLMLSFCVALTPVSAGKQTSVALSRSSLTLEVGKSKTLKLKGAKATKVRWTTSNKAVAAVIKGKVKARKKGKATITALYQKKKYKCKVVVKKKQPPTDEPKQQEEQNMILTIGSTRVKVDWQDNESVTALKKLVEKQPLTVQMSMYGGFEQVGSLGTSLPRKDIQMTTSAGDIVLYSGNQVVVFYGSNSWSYTRLGHISDKSAAEMEELLGHGDTAITFSME